MQKKFLLAYSPKLCSKRVVPDFFCRLKTKGQEKTPLANLLASPQLAEPKPPGQSLSLAHPCKTCVSAHAVVAQPLVFDTFFLSFENVSF